jgi:hypothetical protein
LALTVFPPERTIRLSSVTPRAMLVRQTPGSAGYWNGYRFLVNDLNANETEYDYWVVYGGLRGTETGTCLKGGTFLVTGEPPSVKRYSRFFLRQFDAVVTCDRNLRHKRPIYSYQPLPWHIGFRRFDHGDLEFIKSYDELKALRAIKKSRGISVITSDKTITPGHQLRLEFVKKLKAYFGSDIDVYGRGIEEIQDKWDAIAPYRYHIAIENSVYPDYWTEKLSDAFLGGAYPLYHGCPNIHDYFRYGSLTRIDISDFSSAVAVIKRCLEDNTYEESRDHIMTARNMVLNEYNVFNLLVRVIQDSSSAERSVRRRRVLRRENPVVRRIKHYRRTIRRRVHI